MRPKGFLAGVRYDQTMKKKIALWLRENQCSDLLTTMKEKKTTRLFMKRKGLQNSLIMQDYRTMSASIINLVRTAVYG